MIHPTNWLSKWISILAASLYIIAVILRTWLLYEDGEYLVRAMPLFTLWLFLLLTEPVITRRWQTYFPIYLILQTTLVFMLMRLPGTPDFMATLLGVLSMQVMLRLPTRIGVLWIGLCTVIMGWLLFLTFQYQAIALTLIYTASNVFLGAYTRTIRLADVARQHNQNLASELEQANIQLRDYSTRIEKLAAVRERNRLARELHDSVTQTVFSMNLTSQSAALLLERDPSRVVDQLERMYTLSRSALGEMQILIEELKPEPVDRGGLPDAIHQLLTESRFRDSLSVSVEVIGDQPLALSEQHGLYRIIQEALNNVLKHAKVSQAQVRLHLKEPMWVEIEDKGLGFDTQQPGSSGSLGMVSMHERAAEIGWELEVFSTPSLGTRIRVTKLHHQEVYDATSRAQN